MGSESPGHVPALPLTSSGLEKSSDFSEPVPSSVRQRKEGHFSHRWPGQLNAMPTVCRVLGYMPGTVQKRGGRMANLSVKEV